MLQQEQKILLRYLRKEAARWRDEYGPGFAYDGPAGFVLDHGEWFAPRPAPIEYGAGAPKKCFGNSIIVAALHGLQYVEGYAVDPGTARAVIHHAWNADAAGELVDVTWAGTIAVSVHPVVSPTIVRGMAGSAYLGVPFSVERADDATWNGDRSVLDDSERGWPLFRERWEGEPEIPEEYEGTAERLQIYRERDEEGLARLEAEARL